MSWERIRPVALGLPVRDDEVLVARHYDDTAETAFYRPLGGGVEFGEPSAVGVRREFQEELGAEVTVGDRLATFENIFEFEDTAGHEVVFLYEVEFQDPRYYDADTFEAVEEDGTVFPVRWKPRSDFVADPDADGDVLYPGRLLDVIGE